MNNSFFKNFIILFTGSGLNIIIGLLTTPIITRIVDPAEYGQFSFFNMYANIALLIFSLGLDQSFVRYYYNENSISYKRKLLRECIKLPFILSVVVSVLIALFGRLYTGDVSANIELVLILFGLNLVVLVVNRFSFLVIRLQLKTELFAGLNVLQKLIYAVIIIALSMLIKSNYFIILIFATFMSQFIITAISVAKEKALWKFGKIKNKISVTKKELFKFGYPLVFSFAMTWLFQAAGQIAIKQYGTYEDVGVYAGAMNIIALFTIIQATFNTLWTPMSIEHFEKNKEDKEYFVTANQAITVLMFFFGLSLILFKDIFVLFLGEKYRQAAYIMPFLIFNPIMYTISETTVGGINFMKKSKMHIIVAGGACFFNIIGNYILVPLYGGIGAAISTGLAYIVFFTLRTVLANKYYYINFRLKKFYFLTALTIIYAAYNTFYKFNIYSIVLYIAICMVMYILYKDIIKLGVEVLKSKIHRNNA